MRFVEVVNMGMLSLLLIAVGVVGCALISVALIGVAWAISSNRKPPST